MDAIARIGLDIAKDVFQIHGVDDSGKVVIRRKLRRGEVVDLFKRLAPTIVGIESCATSQHWARALAAVGHRVRIIPASFVKAFVKSQKNDAADAEAICDAVGRPNMRFVPIKSEAQQAVLVVHRVRDLLVRQRTMLINAFRAHVAEFGHVAGLGKLGVTSLMALVEDDQATVIPKEARRALRLLAKEIRHLSDKAKALERQIEAWHRATPRSLKLATIPGIAVITASAFAASIPDPRIFKSGKGLAAWLGLVPRQYSSGDKPKLGGITKRGDRNLRRLLSTGARVVLSLYKRGKIALPKSLAQLAARKPFKVAVVALANKMARIVYAVLAKDEPYRQPRDCVFLSKA